MVGVGTPEVPFFFFFSIYLCFHVLRCLFPFLRQPPPLLWKTEKPAALVCSGSEERRGRVSRGSALSVRLDRRRATSPAGGRNVQHGGVAAAAAARGEM